MKKIILQETYYAHNLEAVIKTERDDVKIEFIPDSIKANLFELLECNETSGTFDIEETLKVNGGYEDIPLKGTWRIIPPNTERETDSFDIKKRIDNATCTMSNVLDELNEIFAEGTLSNEGDEVLEQAIILLEDCLTEIHKFTDPDDQKRLFEEDFDEK